MNNKLTLVAAILACTVSSYAADAAASTTVTVAPVAAPAPAKEIKTLADEDFGAKLLDKFSASAKVGYESEYVFRGTHLSGASITPEVDFGYDIGSGFAVYAGVWSDLAVDNSDYREVDVYTGVTYTYDFATFDVGYIGYLYPMPGASNTNEIKLAASIDTTQWLGEFNVSPYVAFYYDFNLKTPTVEAGLSYTAPVTKWLANRDWGTVDLGGAYGHVSSDNGGYDYVMLSADAVVALNNYCSISAGVRYSMRDNMELAGYQGVNRVWFGTSMTIGF